MISRADPLGHEGQPDWTVGLPLALLALLLPTLLVIDHPPSITFYNQATAVLGWGLWMSWLNRSQPAAADATRSPQGAFMAASLVFWISAGSALGSTWATGLPLGLALMAAGLSAAAWWVMHTGWQSAHRREPAEVMDLLAHGLAWTGVVSVLLALVQVFVPALAIGDLIAEPTMPGRAVGNLRQPNHFSTLLVWCGCAAIWLGRRKHWPQMAAAALFILCIGGVVWTASRTGMVGMLLLTVWGWRDRRMPRLLRTLLIMAPLIYGAWWEGMAWWAHHNPAHHFAGEARLHDGSDISSSRFKIWANTWSLIAAHPWTGVGWGEFNLAWTFSEFPNRPVAFFDHTHNLLLQWAVELGLPLALVLTGLTAWGFVALLKQWWVTEADTHDRLATVALCATLTGMAGLHSLLEYPLWYAYFLLPMAMAWGIGLAAAARASAVASAETAASAAPAAVQPAPPGQSWLALAPGLMMAAGAVWCAIDYQWAGNIYAPREGAGPLSARIQAGQQRLWFGYQADYANATGPDEDEPSLPPQAFKRTLHNLVDGRLMIAYARSLAEHGRVDEARYVVQRLQEFRTGMGKAFMAECQDLAPDETPPFQCAPPQKHYTWREVLPR
jgi:O-antigen ligase